MFAGNALCLIRTSTSPRSCCRSRLRLPCISVIASSPDKTEAGPVDLQAAGQMIDILALLEEKTRGNLTAEERQLLEMVLYELRLRFVEAQGEEKRIITP